MNTNSLPVSSKSAPGFSVRGLVAGALLTCAFLSGALASPESPIFWMKAKDVDLGELLQGEMLDYTIEIRNDGDAILQITKVVPSCSCTEVVGYDASLGPGKSGKIQLKINSKRIKPGKTRKNVRIYTNDPSQPKAVFWFSAICRPLYRTVPSRVALSGIVDQVKEATVDLYATTDLGFEILGAWSRTGKFTIAGHELVEKDKHYRLLLRAGPGKSPGTEKDPLDLKIRVHDGREVTVGSWVYIEHRDHILFSPTTALQFRNSDTDKLLAEGAPPVVKTVTVAAAAENTVFHVTSVKIEGIAEGIFETTVEPIADGKRYAVRVSLSQYQKQTYLRGRLVITTDDPRKPSHELSLQALFGRRVKRGK